MERRRLLSAAGATILAGAAGCSAPSALPVLDDPCGAADEHVADHLTDVSGSVDRGIRPTVLVANDRSSPAHPVISIEGTSIHDREYRIPSGGQTLVVLDTPPPQDTAVMVRLDETSYDDSWPGGSARRKAIAITEDGVRVGWLGWPGGYDPHRCYTWEDAPVRITNDLRDAVELRVVVSRPCTGRRESTTVRIPGRRSEVLRGLLLSGARYVGRVTVGDGHRATFRFPEDASCHGMSIRVTRDHELTFAPIPVF